MINTGILAVEPLDPSAFKLATPPALSINPALSVTKSKETLKAPAPFAVTCDPRAPPTTGDAL